MPPSNTRTAAEWPSARAACVGQKSPICRTRCGRPTRTTPAGACRPAARSATASCIKRRAVASAWLSGGDTPAARRGAAACTVGHHAAAPARPEARSRPGAAARQGGLPMRDDTVTTGQDGYGHKPAGAAGWSVPGYIELKVLGSGGAGDVVLARHDASGTLVAIKYLRRKLLADPQWAGLFRGEAQVLAYLDDPNIVRLYEYVES